MVRPVNEDGGLAAALAEAEAAGVLPITSACNVSCLFCSNRSNPPGVRVWSIPPRSVGDIEAALTRMPDNGEIIIGESASRVTEGEPLTHPDWPAIVRLVRRRRPRALLRLTTNGTLLGPEQAAFLAAHGPVEVTLSLNTASPEAYRRLHGLDADPRRAPAALATAGVPYEASVVAVPAVTGRGDLRETASFLAGKGCLHCRVFVPGYTRRTPRQVAGLMPSRAEVLELVEDARRSVDLPLSLEPPEPADLTARITGVMRGTPAAAAGLRAGDVLVGVDRETPFSRVDAFRRCRRALERNGSCRVRLGRAGDEVEAVLRVPTGEGGRPRPGFVLDRDVDPRDVSLVLGLAERLGARRAVVLTSPLAQRVMALGLGARSAGANHPPGHLVVAVPSRTFGGSIACAGLLTVDDFAAALAGPRQFCPKGRPPVVDGHPLTLRPGDAVFLPPIAFDRSGLDLLGRTPRDLLPLLPRGCRLVVPQVAVW